MPIPRDEFYPPKLYKTPDGDTHVSSTVIHLTSQVETDAIGEGTTIWQYAHVRSSAVVGKSCVVGRGAYVDVGVTVGDNCKVQNYACVYGPAVLGDGVFIGPQAMIANDKYPRAINPDGTLKTRDDWQRAPVTIGEGASIGAGAIVLPGLVVGEWAMIGAGAVVTKDVGPYAVVVGVPARVIGFVDRDGVQRLALPPSEVKVPDWGVSDSETHQDC